MAARVSEDFATAQDAINRLLRSQEASLSPAMDRALWDAMSALGAAWDARPAVA